MEIPASVLQEAERFTLQHFDDDPVAMGAVGMMVGYINAWSKEHNHEDENTVSTGVKHTMDLMKYYHG